MSIRKKIIKDFFNSTKMNRDKWLKKGKTFHKEDIRFLKEIIPEKSNILELGCGNGHLLSSLKPNYGLGIDFSKKLVEEAKEKYKELNFIEADIEKLPTNLNNKIKFNFVIICDTIGYLEDITETLDNLHKYFNEDTRLIVSYYSPLWLPLLNIATLLKLKMSNINSTLLGTSDIFNFLENSKYQTVRIDRKILIPFSIFGIERLINRYIAPLPLFSNICLRHYNISRSLKVIERTKKKSASVIIPCKNERGNIRNAVERLPKFTNKMEVIFVEGNSSDGTWEEIKKVMKDNKKKN